MSKQQITWIKESVAADMLNYKPRTLREYAKSGRLPINFTAPRGRRYQYSKSDIEKVLLEGSTVTN